MSGQFKSPMATRRFFADRSDHKDTDVSNVLKDITETQSGLSKNFPKDENQDPNNSENVDHELLDVLKQMNKANTGISKYLNGLMNSKDPDHEIVKVLKEMSSANTRIYEFLNARKNSFKVDNEATEAPKELIKTSGRSCENLKKIAAGVNRVISLSEDSLAVNKLNKGYLMEIRDYLRSSDSKDAIVKALISSNLKDRRILNTMIVRAFFQDLMAKGMMNTQSAKG